jgi:hypothetical protein
VHLQDLESIETSEGFLRHRVRVGEGAGGTSDVIQELPITWSVRHEGK